MPRDVDLIVGLLAHRLGLVPAELLAAVIEGGGEVGAAVGEPLAEALRPVASALISRAGGDPARALDGAQVDPELRARLANASADRTLVRAVAGEPPPVEGSPTPDDGRRYILGREIGRGGLGRVVEAVDSRLDREVAVKLILADLPPELRLRFEREARLTARLEHPNVVPVHDFGAIPSADGGSELFLSMKRIQGRDLGKVLRSIVRGGEAQRAEWSRARLLGVFQGICLGVAFAHSRGILHRDLKPSNVMLGDFGEVLVVDWGLAREIGAGREGEGDARGAAAPPAAPGTDAGLTLTGDILGTPAYMSPEQATLPAWQLDARSDVFSLGAILYEILALRPPYVGESFDDLITSVKSGTFRAPSAAALPVAGVVPAELETVTLKAMAFRREDRYATAMELHRDVQLYLEGVRERERAQREAAERTAEGRREMARLEEVRRALDLAAREVAELRERTPGHLPPDQKRPLWAAEERLAALEEERVAALTRAAAAFEQALRADPAGREAEDGRCALEFAQLVEAEESRDAAGLTLHTHRLESLDASGRWRERLRAPGTLSLRAFAWECGCTRAVPGYRATADETELVRWREGAVRPGEPIGAAEFPVARMHVQGRFGHGEGCRRREVTGLRVRAGLLVERDRKLVASEMRDLGVTPLRVPLAQGSWRVEVDAPPGSYGPVIAPVRIRRAEEWAQEISLYPAEDVPDGFLLMPGGPFLSGGRWAGGGEALPALTRDLFVARFPVTMAEYLDFVNDLSCTGQTERLRISLPRTSDGSYLPRDPGPPERFRLPLPGPESRGLRGITADAPAFSITWLAAVQYAAWRTEKEGRLFTLLHEEEYEKAARGVDGRVYPWGDHEELSYHHTGDSFADGSRMAPVGQFPADESPYGIRDLAGGICSWCWNAQDARHRDHRALRGGAWEFSPDFCRPAYLLATRTDHVSRRYGLRLAFRPWDVSGAPPALPG